MNTETKPSEDEEFARLELAGAKRTIRIVSVIVLAHSALGLLVFVMNAVAAENGMGAYDWIEPLVRPLVIIGVSLALLLTFSRGFALILGLIYAFLILIQLLVTIFDGYLELMHVIGGYVVPGILLWLSITAVKAGNTIRKLNPVTISDSETKL